MGVSVIVGTRPEIIKMSPVIFELKRRSIPFNLVHTGQHYDKMLSDVFFDELGIPKPDCFLSVGSGSQAEQTARAMISIERQLLDYDPEIVLVQGDTNTVLAGALAGTKAGFPVGHVEAGLRSYDLRMPEEHNRRLTDHVSAFLFAPTEISAENLRKESVPGNIFVTGNTVIDACNRYIPIAAERSTILSRLNFKKYCLITAHRAENVDNPKTLANFVEIFTRCPIPIVYPIHPRTRKLLTSSGLMSKLDNSQNVQLIDPVGYFDFLTLMKNCEFIMTDSGGIQEEATSPSINKKVFVLRLSTERPEAVESGHAKVVGTEPDGVLREITSFISGGFTVPSLDTPFGKGDAAVRIVEHLTSETEHLGKNRINWKH